MDMLAVMHDGEPYGHLTVNGRRPSTKQLSTVFGTTEKAAEAYIQELEDAGVFSRAEDGTIYNRRMVRDKAASEKASTDGKSGGNPEIRRGSAPKADRVRSYRQSDSPEKTKRILARSGGLCHWCGTELEVGASDLKHNTFHVDHLQPVADGGSNAESNLVAACADCNHKRARTDWSHPSDPYCGVNVGIQSDPKLKNHNQESDIRKEERALPSVVPHTREAGRGCRLPDGWVPDDSGYQFASSLGLDPNGVLASFSDYWRSKPGKDGTKSDWPATWRNWCRSDARRGGARSPIPKPNKLENWNLLSNHLRLPT